MERTANTKELLIAQAEQAKRIMADGGYRIGDHVVDLHVALVRCRAGVELITPEQWGGILHESRTRCIRPAAALVTMTAETTLQALERLAGKGCADIAALNFASARRPGGGWDTGASAQEETLARSSALIITLERAPEYYAANRQYDHLFYSEHAIWSPAVPFFAQDDGTLMSVPYQAGIITMPAPNVGAMIQLNEADCLALPALWRRRIGCVLALAIHRGVRHLVLGAWGCGAFGNDPILVTRCFHEALYGSERWLNGLESVTFAINDSSRHQNCYSAFRSSFPLQEGNA